MLLDDREICATFSFMSLSPLYSFLVYLEHKKSITKDELAEFGEKSSRGIIGKMEAMGFISRKEAGGQALISLSKKGYDFLNSVLDAIHKNIEHWDGRWRIISFSIPEKNRFRRDKFRRFLEAKGLKMIVSGVWATPFDLKEKIYAEANKLDILDRIVIFETDKILGISQEAMISAWNFVKYRKMFEDFIQKSDEFLQSGDQDENRCEVKRLIFEYALILNNEPKVPIELVPKDWPKFRANMNYRKLKNLLSKS